MREIVSFSTFRWLGLLLLMGFFACTAVDPNQVPCTAKSTRECQCIGARIEGKRICYKGTQTCKDDGTGYPACVCTGSATSTAGSGSAAGSGAGSAGSASGGVKLVEVPCSSAN